MQIRFLLGPAGSGKTFRCLSEIRAALTESPEGPPLLFLAPKQATFQLERQLLADPALPGYTRLQILSFERLAEFILAELRCALPSLLSDEGRLMVLRALLQQKHKHLQLFRASARLPGFAQQLSVVLRELQRFQAPPRKLAELAAKDGLPAALGAKLSDLALLLQSYLDWLDAHQLKDASCLLELASEALREIRAAHRIPASVSLGDSRPQSPLRLAGLWLDGFAEMTPQELELLAALAPCCQKATLAFCLEDVPKDDLPWLSIWSGVSRTFRQCYHQMRGLPEGEVSVEVLPRDPGRNRFSQNPVLGHLEEFWTQPKPFTIHDSRFTIHDSQITGAEFTPGLDTPPPKIALGAALRLALCPNPEAEAILAAREILRFVRSGARFRDCAVLLRTFEGYHDVLRRVLNRYEIPFFMDRREPVAHHPLAELTRFALRTVALDWRQEDWFDALKTGFAPADEAEIDWLENEALARGWEGRTWRQPLAVPNETSLGLRLEELRQRIIRPFELLAARIAAAQYQPNGAQLAAALAEFWSEMKVEQRLQDWSAVGVHSLGEGDRRRAAHATVWAQMNDWLENLERAFAAESLPLRDWLPILEAGLSGLTVGVIPPALDQVLIGTIDRSRNPDLKLVVVLGLNESVFPAAPRPNVLLTDTDRAELEGQKLFLGPSVREQLGQERFYGYIACTRARQRLVLTCAAFDTRERKLNPSRFLAHVQQLFPGLKIEEFSPASDWLESEHISELIAPLLGVQSPKSKVQGLADVLAWLPVASRLEQITNLREPASEEPLSAALAERLYGREFQTSVTHLERFAECPFRFFVHSGLRAQERLLFEADARQVGSFQHEALRLFHEAVRVEHKRWRDFSPREARGLMGRIADELAGNFGGGIFQASEQARFAARSLVGALEAFVETLVGWMRERYDFDPVAAELRFHSDGPLPPWRLPLADGHHLVFTGIIDRVDLWVAPDQSFAYCVVLDYKSSARKIDERLLANGVQLQLPAYLSVLRQAATPQPLFGVPKLIPAGVFYVNLRGHYERGRHRDEVLNDETARALAYRHSGRFDAGVLRHLDQRADPGTRGEQFQFELKKDGEVHGRSKDPMPTETFLRLLDRVEAQLKEMGERIFRGEASVDPYRHGNTTPCERCDYRAVCRIDPWTHAYRALKEP